MTARSAISPCQSPALALLADIDTRRLRCYCNAQRGAKTCGASRQSGAAASSRHSTSCSPSSVYHSDRDQGMISQSVPALLTHKTQFISGKPEWRQEPCRPTSSGRGRRSSRPRTCDSQRFCTPAGTLGRGTSSTPRRAPSPTSAGRSHP